MARGEKILGADLGDFNTVTDWLIMVDNVLMVVMVNHYGNNVDNV